MCEQFVARSAEPFRLDELWPMVERMERFGIAGFGWGAAWLEQGVIHEHRDTRAFRDDPTREAIANRETTTLLVHLRRPSRLSTLQLSDTQPFTDADGRFAFSHNGEFERWHGARVAYRDQDRIRGRADSEVAQRWLEDAWTFEGAAADRLAEMHAGFGGLANLALLTSDGDAHHYADNPENPVFTFRLGPIGVASTALYSIDRSLFRLAAAGATDRRVARRGTTIRLDERGNATAVTPGGRPTARA